MSLRRLVRPMSFVFLLAVPLAAAQSAAQDKLHRAYYLENEKTDFGAAAKLYDELIADPSADAALKTEARTHRAICKEELACSDLAKLMPSTALAYAELSRPGDQISKLLRQLGLLATDGKLAPAAGKRIAISPDLVSGLLGIRGVAAAVTGFDPQRQMPSGVAILHAGHVDLLRGALQTALPVAANPIDPIEGYAAFDIEGHVTVAVTNRLIIAGTSRAEVAGVIERLDGDSESLLTNPAFAEELKSRDGSLLFACVSFEPILPLLKAGMAVGGTANPEFAAAQTMLDPDSLRSVRARVGVSDDGIAIETSIRLADGHHNLAYNLLRLPPVDVRTLAQVPAGAAGFASLSLTDAAAQYRAAPPAKGETAAPVTMLDFVRELVANVIGLTVFVMPGAPDTVIDHDPIPNFAAVITVHDPEKSRVLWTQALGMASASSLAGTLTGERSEADGATIATYSLPDGVKVSLAMRENVLVLTPSRSALQAALGTLRGGQSIRDDVAFSPSLAALSPDASLAAFVHVGRVLETARGFMSPHEQKEIEPFRTTFDRTVGSLTLTQGATRLSVALRVTGLPNVGPVLSQLIQQRHERRHVPQFSQIEISPQPVDAVEN